jgi:hypothetical protein
MTIAGGIHGSGTGPVVKTPIAHECGVRGLEKSKHHNQGDTD